MAGFGVGPHMSAAEVEIRKNDAASRYELWVAGRLAGQADYEADYEPDHGANRRADTSAIAITHTFVDPALNGQGLGSRLVRFALDDIRSLGRQVVPACPFVGVFVQRNPEYADLLA